MLDHEEAIIKAMSHNDPVSDALQATARAMVREAEATIAQLDSAIEDLKRQRSDATVKAQYRSTFAPHRIVPKEILGEIFSYCNSNSVFIPWDPSTSPWTISYVCRKWRSVVLGTHSLWRYIEVLDGGPCSRFTDMALELIRRGGNGRIHMKGHSLEMDCPEAFFDLIATNLPRFERLEIGGSISELMPVISSFPGNTKDLQRLSIECYNSDSREMLHLPVAFLQDALSLQELAIVELGIPPASLLCLSLSNITVLNLSNTFLECGDMLPLLNRCLSIQACNIGVRRSLGRIRQAQKYGSLTLPCLESFVLKIDPISPGSPSLPFLAALIMPNLSGFHIINHHEWEIDFTLALAHSGRLKRFNIASSLSAADLNILLPAMPDMEHLYFKDAVLSTQTLQGIASGALLSKMQYSRFTCTVHTLDALGLHLDVVEQRFNRGLDCYGGLSRLRLLWHYNLSDPAPAMRRFHRMAAAGWDITLVGIA